MPELEMYRISDTRLLQFLCLIRSTYHTRAAYHNFRHAADVLQAVYFWLLTSRLLPPHPSSSSTFNTAAVQPPFNILLPKNLLAICLAAIGHDAGHPGLTNAFLIGAKSSLAKIYNDHSVLESLHAMATTRLISQVWPQIFDGDEDDETGQKFRRGGTGMRKSIVEMILSTDMGLHFEFMEKFTELKSKLQNKFAISTLSPAKLEEYRTIILCLCLKCADISNVVSFPLISLLFTKFQARPFPISIAWSNNLLHEQRNQSVLEMDIGMHPPRKPTYAANRKPSLYATPDPITLRQQAEAQLGFINVFVLPLYNVARSNFFPGMTDIWAYMQTNIEKWTSFTELVSQDFPEKADGNESITSPISPLTMLNGPATLSSDGGDDEGSNSIVSPEASPITDQKIRAKKSRKKILFWKSLK